MQINDYNSGKVGLYQTRINQTAEEARTRETKIPGVEKPEGDLVEISQAAREITRVKTLAEAAEPVRQDKVDAVKARLRSGEYQVKPDETAEKLLTDSLQDLL